MKNTLYPIPPIPFFLERFCRVWRPVLACAVLVAGAIALPGAARAAQTATELLAALEAEGFENLAVEEDASGILRIVFEDRRYRWEIAGLGVVLGIASAHQEGRIAVVPLHTGIPMMRLELEAADYRAFLRGEMSESEVFSRMAISNAVEKRRAVGSNPSYGRVDLTFSPGIRVNLETPPPPGVFTGGEIRLNPGVYATLWRGVTFDGVYSYPLSSSDPVIARAAASLNGRLGKQGFFQAQAGRLSDGLNGLAAQASYLSPSGQHLVGLTGTNATYEGWDRILAYQGFYTWRPSSLDVALTLTGGRYLKGDNGYGLRMTSGFAERRIDFFVTKTDLNRTLGVAFTFPLGWQRQPMPGAVRARLRNEFGFAYTDPRPSTYDRRDGGLMVPFSDRFQFAVRRLNRAYLRAYAPQLREAGKRWVVGEAAGAGL